PVELPAAVETASQATATPPAEPQPEAEQAPQETVAGALTLATENSANGEWRGRSDDPGLETPQNIEGNIEIVRFDSSEPATHATATNTNPQPPRPPTGETQPSSETSKQSAEGAPSPAAPAQGATSSASSQAVSFAAQLDMLEIELSRRIAGPAHLWLFEDLEKETERLAGLATQAEHATRLRELSSRMVRFADIANRHRAALAPAVARHSAAAPQGLPAVSANSVPAATAQGYDAVGVLRPVVSRRAGAPPYALVDD